MKAKVKEDFNDIPMAYFWYVVFTIIAIAVTGAALIVGLFSGGLKSGLF